MAIGKMSNNRIVQGFKLIYVIFDRPQTDGQAINCLQSLIAFCQQILNIVAPCLISQTAVQCIMAYEFLFRYRHSIFIKWLAKLQRIFEIRKYVRWYF